MNRAKPVSIRVWGDFACFIMPEFHVERVSRSVITPSAVPHDVGPFRGGTAPCATEKHVIPAFLELVFGQQQSICAN